MTFARARVRSRGFVLLAALVVIWPMVFFAVANPGRVLASSGLVDHFALTTPPTAVAGTPFTITLAAVDEEGNPVSNYSGPKTINWTGGLASPNSSTASLPTSSVTFNSSGVATTPLSATFVAKGSDTLKATDASNAALTGLASLTVGPGAFVSVAITPEDSTITADQGTETYALTGTDAYGNTGDATADSGFTIDSAACAANACGSRTAGAYSVEGTDLDNSDQTGLTVLHGVATQLVVTTSPSSPSTADATFSVKVTIEDAYGNTVIDGLHHDDLITLSLSGGNTSTFSGPSTATAADGVATFSGLAVRKVGTLYKFTAKDAPLTAGDSSHFEITPGALHHFVWNSATQTAGNIALQKAGVPIDPSPYVTAYDQYNNIKTDLLSDPDFVHTFTNSPNGTSFVASIAWSDGVGTVTATPVTADLVGNQHFTVSHGGITAGGDSNHFKVNPNDAATTVFSDTGFNGQPLDTKVDTPIYSVCTPAERQLHLCDVADSTGVKVLATIGTETRSCPASDHRRDRLRRRRPPYRPLPTWRDTSKWGATLVGVTVPFAEAPINSIGSTRSQVADGQDTLHATEPGLRRSRRERQCPCAAARTSTNAQKTAN